MNEQTTEGTKHSDYVTLGYIKASVMYLQQFKIKEHERFCCVVSS